MESKPEDQQAQAPAEGVVHEKKTAEQRKAEKEAKKLEKAAKKAQKGKAGQGQESEFVKDPNDPSADKFGDMELIRSQISAEERHAKKYVEIKDIDDSLDGQEIRIRGRVHNSRAKGKQCFLVIRQAFATVQACLFAGDGISPGMVKYSGKIPRESIIEIVAKAVKPDQPINGASQQLELQVSEIWTVNKSAPVLPFQLEDASRQVLDQEAESGPTTKADTEESKDGKMPVVKQDVRLNNRIIDLRVPTNQAIFRLQSGVCQIYREFLLSKGFIEIHSPKLIGGSSEGGANIFKLKYFEQDACLAQSPQLYKQMALCGDLQRVFEIGPVFRAENSNTNRHLCEFTGLDMEMEFHNHYFEVLDLIGELMVFLFKSLKERHDREIKIIQEQYPFEDFKCADPVFKLSFKEGVKLLQEAGYTQDPLEDLDTVNEKALGKIVRDKYDTDFYMLYGYPVNARPFYTMLDPADPNYTNSYDFFMRGEEITSGAQRIHDPVLLAERATVHGIPVETIKDYIESFKYGAPAHAGAGFGLERVVKFYCNLANIRKCSLFPRDPQRLAP